MKDYTEQVIFIYHYIMYISFPLSVEYIQNLRDGSKFMGKLGRDYRQGARTFLGTKKGEIFILEKMKRANTIFFGKKVGNESFFPA